MFKNPDLAGSLRSIADEGRAGFYEGTTADAILALSREHGGTMTGADLKEFEPEWVDADLDDVSRLDRLRAAAEHSRDRGADDART